MAKGSRIGAGSEAGATSARHEPVARPAMAALAGSLAVLLILRALAESRSDALAWGMDFARFLGPGWRLGPWAAALVLATLAAFAPFRTWIARRIGWLGSLPREAALLAALACGAMCLAFPDRTFFTGDFVLRRAAVAGTTNFDRLFPQAMPLDRMLHLVLPRALREWTSFSVETVASAMGVIEAALFGALAVGFARLCGARGLAALVAAGTVAGGAALGLFTGYDKSFAELSVVTLAFAVAGLGELSRGRPGWASGLLVALAVALHRSGLALLLPWLVLWATVPTPAGGDGRRRLPWARLGPALLAAAHLPLIWRIARAVDARHLAPKGSLDALASAFEPGRLAALANLAVFLIPLAPLFPAAFALARSPRDPALRWLGWLAVAWLLPMFAIHPVQGEFRDWDDFAAGGVAAALPLALLLARGVARGPAPLAIALSAAALVPRVQWLALETTPTRALARIEAWVSAPHPPRSVAVAAALEYLATDYFEAGRLDDWRRTMRRTLAEAPWVRVYLEWAAGEFWIGNKAGALDLCEQAVRQAPNDPTPWFFMVEEGVRFNDRQLVDRAMRRVRELVPHDRRLAELEAAVRAMPDTTPPR